MALDVYWQASRNAKARIWLGSLEIETPLEDLLYRFGQATGLSIDPYGKARLSAEQWQRLVGFASQAGYPSHQLKQIQAAIPVDDSEGTLVLVGD